MTSLTFSTRLLAAIFVCAVAPTLAHAQSDTVSISGTFQMSFTYGLVGPDLAGVYDRQMDHAWTLTLSGVTYEYEYTFEDYTTPEGGVSYERSVSRLFIRLPIRFNFSVPTQTR